MAKIFYKNIEEKTWGFVGGKTGIPIKQQFRFTGVVFKITSNDGNKARYKQNCEDVRLSKAITYTKKHHNGLTGSELVAHMPRPDLTGLTRITLNVHNEQGQDYGYIILPEKSGSVAYVETRYLKELKNSVYDCWLNDSQLKEIGLAKEETSNGKQEAVSLPEKQETVSLPEKQDFIENIEKKEPINSHIAEIVKEMEDSNKISFDPSSINDAREKVSASIVRRRGQPEFRAKLLEIYNERCAISDTNAKQALEAAHIIPYKGIETNHPSNGLLLRADIHTLFDLGLIAIDSEMMTVIIAPELGNTTYQELSGKKLFLPINMNDHPSKEALTCHRRLAGL